MQACPRDRFRLVALLATLGALGGCGSQATNGDTHEGVSVAHSMPDKTGAGANTSPNNTSASAADAPTQGVNLPPEPNPGAGASSGVQGDPGAGSPSPLPPDCTVQEFSYSPQYGSCSLTAECAGVATRVDCQQDGDGARCSCRGGFSVDVTGAAGEGAACSAALAGCALTLDDLTCERDALSGELEEDFCYTNAICTKDIDVSSGAHLHVWHMLEGICSYEAERWACSCEGQGAYLYRLQTASDPLSACSQAERICDLEPVMPDFGTATACVFVPARSSADGTVCHLEANCYSEEITWADDRVEPWQGRTVDCAKAGDGWNCSCEQTDYYVPGSLAAPPDEQAPCIDYFTSECGGVL